MTPSHGSGYWSYTGFPDSSKKPRKPRAKKVDTFIDPACEESPSRLSFKLPIKTISLANRYEHWAARASRIRSERAKLDEAIKPKLSLISLPCRVLMKRFGPRLLDEHDNLRMSMKSLVDSVAKLLVGGSRGKGDSDPRLAWAYDQQVSKSYGIEITFEF